MRSVALFESGPEIDDPGSAPARVSTSGAEPALKRSSGGLCQLRCLPYRDRTIRVKRKQVRDVPVPRLRLVVVLDPLLQLTMFADSKRQQFSFGVSDPAYEIGVNAENLGGTYDSLKQRPRNFGVHRRAHTELPDLPIRSAVPVLR